ncbi:MAG: zf-HC2 domain-containing protein [Acidobacteriota bacterium]
MTTKRADSRCREVHVDLPALAAGQLDERSRVAIEQHLSFCPGCQFEWRQHQLVWRCLGWSGDVDPPPDLKARVLEAIRAHETARGG